MARFYISLQDKPKVRVEISKDISERVKPDLINIFGIPFLQSETVKGNLLVYEFIADEEDCNTMIGLLTKWQESRIVQIDIDLILN